MTESDIILLIGYLHALPQQVDPVRSGGKLKRHDAYRAVLTSAQRDLMIEALRSYRLP